VLHIVISQSTHYSEKSFMWSLPALNIEFSYHAY